MTTRNVADPEREFRLAALLALHARERHPLELPDALGDGALLNRLPPLRYCRGALTRFGYRFAPASEIGGLHSMFPTLELMEIFRTRTIPFRRTALAAQRVLKSDPNLRLSPSLFRELCVASYSFHEGAHAIFYELAEIREEMDRDPRLVEVLLASEAFAIAFEQLVAMLALQRGERSTSMFLALSAYVNPLDLRRLERDSPGAGQRLGRLAAEHPAAVLTFLAAANLIALVRPKAVAAKTGLAERLSEYAQLPPHELEEAELLIAVGFHLDFDFRGRTQRNFFGYLGLQKELDRLMGEPVECRLEPVSALFTILPQALRCVLEPAEGAS